MTTADLFNGTLASAGIAAAFKLGILEIIERDGEIGLDVHCKQHDLDYPAVAALASVLHHGKIVEFHEDSQVVRRGPLFADAYAEKGYFYWLFAGYGSMLQSLADVVQSGDPGAAFAKRNPTEIAFAAGDYGARFVDGVFEEALDEVQFSVAGDIGCGTAGRLIELAKNRPGFRGVGVEIDEGLVDLATAKAEAAGVADRVQVFQGDLSEMLPNPAFQEVELLFSFFMAHDLWPRADCVHALSQVRHTFPNVARFLLCDTYRSDSLLTGDVPIFTLGFELTHAMMRQYVPSVSEWMEVFEESGWECVGQRMVGIPFSCIFDLHPRP